MLLKIIKKDPVLFAALFCAVISAFFVLPDRQYIDYIDYRTIGLLFCLMSVVAGFSAMGLIKYMAEKILSMVKNTRTLVFVLWMLCFFSSMLITNDVALITFVPLAIAILTLCKKKELIIYTLVLQTAGANMGSMLTPVGNPQNLYLYGKFNIPTGEFFSITLPVILLSFVVLCVMTFGVPSEKISAKLESEKADIKKVNIIIYTVLAVVSLLSVVRLADWRIAVILTALALIIFDHRTLSSVDWLLLMTFCAFFVFVGNIERIPFIKDIIEGIINKSAFGASLIASQIISNVPAAVVLSGFTQNYRALVLGTDIGGLGSLIASLAGLISFKFYTKIKGADVKRYITVFTVVNVVFLLFLILFYTLGIIK